MYQISQITSDPSQTQTLTLPDNSIITFSLYYAPQQYCWFADVTYNTFELLGLMITASPNMLRQWKNQIPFGLSCNTLLLREPTQQQDFLSNAFQLFILSPEDVQEYEAYLEATAPN
jgi:hypothetical protein